MNNPMEPIEAMDPVKKRKHSSRRRNRRSKRRRVLINEKLYARRSKIEKLPDNCLERILSFVTYEKVTQLRLVSIVFNDVAIKVLEKGQKELEGRLGREIKRAEMRKAHFSINVRSSNDTPRFLKGLFEAINDCTITYWIYTDYFVAGKLLDVANVLLNDCNSSSAVPYFVESVRDQKPHPLLGPISELSEKARVNFRRKILFFRPYRRRGPLSMRYEQRNAELKILREQNKMKIMKKKLLENLRRKIDCGNELSGGLVKLILKLNEGLMDLTQRAKKVDEEVEPIINGKDHLDGGHSNCLYPSFSSLSLGETKMMKIPKIKRPNLATLPPSCIKNIISHFNCDKIGQLRAVCKSFNEVCKKGLNEEFVTISQILQFRKDYDEKENMLSVLRGYNFKINLLKDVSSLLRMCEDNYKGHVGSGFYFAAGRVLDEAKRIYVHLFVEYGALGNRLYYEYESQPHWSLFPLMDMVYKSIAHFKFNVVPKYFPSTQTPTHVPDDVITGEMLSFEEESQLSLEEIERLVEETEMKIKKQNERNKNSQKIVSGLKKKVFILSQKISEKINVLKELELNRKSN